MTAETLLQQLADPRCYPHAPAEVELLQTHLSVVCLAGDLVYKLKKARKFPFVDYSTRAARDEGCRNEVRLNRRLCPEVYLGTAALCRCDGTPELRFAPIDPAAAAAAADPQVLEHAVVMRRLPATNMLDQQLLQQTVPVAAIEGLARQIADFHRRADRSAAVQRMGSPERLLEFARANYSELAAIADHGLPPTLLTALQQQQEQQWHQLLPRLRKRAARGFVVDGHGDLHARNICMTTPATVYDCLEFAQELRCADTATENAFLLMDLRYRRAPQLAAAYLAAYMAASDDHEQAELLPPLIVYRAMVRAKVAALAAAADEMPAAERKHAQASAQRHLEFAAAVAVAATGPRWLVVFGPPASGKSSLCRALHELTDWPQLATDVLRKQLAGLAPQQRASAEHYRDDFTARTYRRLAAEAAAATAADHPVVLLDGNFSQQAQRDALRQAAAAAGVQLSWIQLSVPVAEARRRATQRAAAGTDASDADAVRAADLHAAFAFPSPAEKLAAIELAGDQPSEELRWQLLAALLNAPAAT